MSGRTILIILCVLVVVGCNVVYLVVNNGALPVTIR